MPAYCDNAPQAYTAPREQVLAMQMARLGDFLQSTKLLAVLRAKHPGAEINVMVTPAQAPLARRCRFADKVVLVKPAEISAISGVTAMDRSEKERLVDGLNGRLAPLRPGHIYNLNMSTINTTIAAAWSGAEIHGWRMSADGQGLYGPQWFGFMMSMVADRRLTRTHLTDLLACIADAPPIEFNRLQYQNGPRAAARAAALITEGLGTLVGLQLGTNCDLRRWPVASFASLAQGLVRAGYTPVLVGAPSEQHLGLRLLEAMNTDSGKVLNLMGKTDLPALASVLGRCGLVVSGDTGTLHLATAVGAKTLSLFMGPAQVHETGPYGEGHLIIQARDKCGPCQEQTAQCQGRAPCRGLIRPEAALKAALALLQGAGARQAAAELALPPGVLLLEGKIDAYGQRYKVLTPQPLSTTEAAALALREAGRVLTQNGYEYDDAGLADELADEHLPADEATKTQVGHLARQAAAMARAAEDNDPAAAAKAAGLAPELRPLALTNKYNPARLAKACRTAVSVLHAAAGCGP